MRIVNTLFKKYRVHRDVNKIIQALASAKATGYIPQVDIEPKYLKLTLKRLSELGLVKEISDFVKSNNMS